MKSKTKSSRGRSILAHTVLILLSFMCLFFFYVLIINATRSHAELQKGFSALPGKYFFTNLKNVAMTEASRCSVVFEQFDRIRVFSSIMYLFFSSDSIWTLCL